MDEELAYNVLGIVPKEALPVPSLPYVYYMWPELQQAVTPIVRLHILFGGDIDLPCTCKEGYDRNKTDHLWNALEECQRMLGEMMRERGWTLAGSAETQVTCTHEYDPRKLREKRT